MGRMTVFSLLFGIGGRINRAKFYIGLALLCVLHAIAYGVAIVLNSVFGWAVAADELIGLSYAWSSVVLLWPLFGLYAKRIHDIGHSAGFGLLVIAGKVVFILDQLVYQMDWVSQGWVWLGGGMLLFLLLASSDAGKNLHGEESSDTRLSMLIKLSSM